MRTEIEAGVRTVMQNLKERRVSSSALHFPLITTCWHKYSSCSCFSERKGWRRERTDGGREGGRERTHFWVWKRLILTNSRRSYKSRIKYERRIAQISGIKAQHTDGKHVTLGSHSRHLQQPSAAFPETGVMGTLNKHSGKLCHVKSLRKWRFKEENVSVHTQQESRREASLKRLRKITQTKAEGFVKAITQISKRLSEWRRHLYSVIKHISGVLKHFGYRDVTACVCVCVQWGVNETAPLTSWGKNEV